MFSFVENASRRYDGRRHQVLRTALLPVALLVTGATVAEAQATGDRVEVNGMQMYYEVSGAGEGAHQPVERFADVGSEGGGEGELEAGHRIDDHTLRPHPPGYRAGGRLRILSTEHATRSSYVSRSAAPGSSDAARRAGR